MFLQWMVQQLTPVLFGTFKEDFMKYIVHLTIVLFFIICTLELSFAQGDLSATLQGQDSSTKLTVGTIQVPSSQATKTGAINALIETGNANILANPSFEHSTFSTGWSSAVTGTAVNTLTAGTNSTKELGAKRLNFSCAGGASGGTCTISQDVSTSKTVQGLALAYISTDTPSGVKLKPRANGAEISGLEVSSQTTSEFLYKVPFTLGSSSSGLEVEITVSAGVTITGTVDAAFVGAVDLSATQSFDTTCDTIACQTEFSAKVSSTGVVTDENMDWISGNCTNASPAVCTFSITLANPPNCTVSQGSGTHTIISAPSASNTSVGVQYNGNSKLPFQIACQKSGSDYTAAIQAQKDFQKTKISSFSSTNADTDWASCGHTTSDFTGFGTVTSIQTQCKREGSDLLMRGRFVVGTPSSVEARLALKLNGVALTSASSSTITNLQLAGSLYQNFSNNTYYGNTVLIEPSVAYVTFANVSNSTNGLTKGLGSATFGSSALASITARIPISGWTNSNLIIGQFNGLESCANTLECTDTFSADVSSTGVVSNENVDWINGNFSISTTYNGTFNSGIFTVAPNCVASAVSSGGGSATRFTSISTGGANLYITNDTGTSAGTSGFKIICTRTGADYIGKTAKAVASDQNVRSIGSVGVDIQSISYGGNSTCSSVCNASPCTVCNPIGSKVTSMTRIGLGQYNLNGVDGIKYNCQINGYGGTTYTAPFHDKGASSSSLARITSANATTVVDSYGTITCTGIP
jgi:hypothetical protein